MSASWLACLLLLANTVTLSLYPSHVPFINIINQCITTNITTTTSSLQENPSIINIQPSATSNNANIQQIQQENPFLEFELRMKNLENEHQQQQQENDKMKLELKRSKNKVSYYQNQNKERKEQLMGSGMSLRPLSGSSKRTTRRRRRRAEVAAIAAEEGDEEAGIKQHEEILIGKDDQKMNEDYKWPNEINAEIRNHEYDEESEQARRECVAYHEAYTTTKKRTDNMKIANYEYEITNASDGTPVIETGQRANNKYGVLRLAPESVYKVTAIINKVFKWVDTKWGVTFSSREDEYAHTGTQHVMVPFKAAVEYYLFHLINHPLFQATSTLYHTIENRIYLDLMLLFDAKAVKRSREDKVTVILVIFPTISSDIIKSFMGACPLAVTSQKDKKCTDTIRSIKKQQAEIKAQGGMVFPVLRPNAAYDSFEIEPDNL